MDVVARLTPALAGRYRLEREIGSGGMATVWLAHDERHDRKVALKVLRQELAAVIGADRFLSEIRTTANLQHPGILPLFDSGEAGGQLFYVMPFVEGESLRARLDRERQLPVAEAVRIATEVAEALAYAHANGVVHRDVKPENILLQAGRPLVADFGIALAVQEAGGNRLTQTGLSLGTPRYMSPEQAAAERTVDGRTDQYALAAVLYEMLAGEPPFTAPSTQALIAKLMSEEPRPIGTLRRHVPPHVAAAMHRALEKLPADRFATAADLATALTTAGSGTGLYGAPAVRVRARSWMPAVLGALAAGAVLGVGADRIMRRAVPSVPPAPVRFRVEADSGQRLALECCGRIFAVSPDGRRLAFQAIGADGISRVHVRELGSFGSRPLAGTDNPRELFFSPDGNRVGFSAGRALRTVDLQTGVVRTIADKPSGYQSGGTWTDDGRILFAVGGTIYAVPEDGGAATVLHAADSAQRGAQLADPHFVADARAVLFASYASGQAEAESHILWLANGRTRRVAMGVGPTFVVQDGTSRGWLLTVRWNGTLEARPFDAGTGDTLGRAMPLEDGIALRSPVWLYAEYTASPSGTIVTASRPRGPGADQGVLLMASEGTREEHHPPFKADHIDGVRFSPDGTRLLLTGWDNDAQTHTVYAYDPTRRSAARLTATGDVEHGGWGRTGDSVVFLRWNQASRRNEFVVQGARGTGGERLLGAVTGWDFIQSEISVRLPWVAFIARTVATAVHDVAVAHVDSMDRARVIVRTRFAEDHPSISPDGRRLAFISDETGRPEVYVASFPDASDRIAISNTGARLPRWASDGTLFYLGLRGEVYAVPLPPGPQLAMGTPRTVMTMPSAIRYWDVDPSGRRFAFASTSGRVGDPRLDVTVNALPPLPTGSSARVGR